jgi:CDGSH-type Zn-finger protein
MPPVQLTPLPDGPYQVAGELKLVTHDGQAIAAAEPPIYLCRCGHSASKPFCDGSHARIGWKDDA